VARDFAAAVPDRLRPGDITYVATREGWCYLAVVLYSHSRHVIGWAMADHLRTELALDALATALRARHPPPGRVRHTDRSSQYTAAAYQALLAARALRCR
jgi:putative transposase